MTNQTMTMTTMKNTAAMLAVAFSMAVAAVACTAATPDSPGTGGTTGPASGGATGTGGAATATGGAVGGGTGGSTAPGTGGADVGSTGGSTGTGTGGSSTGNSGGATGSSGGAGGAPASSGGSTAATGGRAGTGGATATGGAAAGGATATGCDWTNTAGRIVLFDGTSLDQWKNLKTGGAAQWKIIGDTMEVVPLEPPTDIQSKMKFEDLCVHVEYMTPTYPSNITGQSRGNSGVFLKSAYEMQILDSIGKPPAIDTCGAVYSIAAPLVVACNMELVWNTYEIEFKASTWDAAGKKTKNAVFVSATLNGKVVQRNIELNPAGGFTQAGQPDAAGPQSLMLQDHRNLVRFRNIWVKVPHY